MSISASELLKYSAKEMNHTARYSREHEKEKEIKNILGRISLFASKGDFNCPINHIQHESTIDILKKLGYKLEKVESFAETFSWKISWEGEGEG